MKSFNVLTADEGTMRKVLRLVEREDLFLSSYNSETDAYDDGVYPAINCGDIFVGGADAEALLEEDLDDFIAVVKQWPISGADAWVAFKRGITEVPRYYGPEGKAEYQDALDGIPKLLAERRGEARGPIAPVYMLVQVRALSQKNPDGSYTCTAPRLSHSVVTRKTLAAAIAALEEELSALYGRNARSAAEPMSLEEPK